MTLSISLEAAVSPSTVHWQGHDLRFGELLGTGRFSKVYALEGTPTMVVKLTQTDQLSPSERQRFLDEPRLFRDIRHPHIISVFGSVTVGHNFHMTLHERACGGELLDRVQAMAHGFDEQLASRWVRQLLLALEHLHDLGIIHRDLKPENLLLANEAYDAPLKIADFGGAKRVLEESGDHTPTGSRGYAAPEQVGSPASSLTHAHPGRPNDAASPERRP